MLILNRKPGEEVAIGRIISLTVPPCRADRVLIGIDAPRSISVLRAELLEHARDLGRKTAEVPANQPACREVRSWSDELLAVYRWDFYRQVRN